MRGTFRVIFYVFFLFCPLSPVWPKTIFVGPTSYPHSIQQAIKIANGGDTILVSRAHYFEKNLIINKPITLLGVNYPILDGEKKYEVLSIKSSNVTISGFQIIDSGASSLYDLAAIKIYDSSHVHIVNNKISNAFFGIYVQYGSECIIENNLILATGTEEQASGNGIHCWNSHNLRISNNVISGHRDGIYFEFVKNSVIKMNRSFRNLRYGLHFMFSNHDTYLKNVFSDNGAGVAVMFSNHVNMYHNIFQQNWGDASYGILLKEIMKDIESEEKETIKNFLWGEFGKELLRHSIRGFPEYYKEKLLSRSFNE
jgi:nitrous oxidase accessory protein